MGDAELLDRETHYVPGIGARRAHTAAGDKRSEHARDASGRAAHGAVCALFLDQVKNMRVQMPWQYRRV